MSAPEPPPGYRIIPREYLEAGNPLPGDALWIFAPNPEDEWEEVPELGTVHGSDLDFTYATAEPLPCFDSAPEQALPATGDAARIAELELALAVIGDLAVADWDSETVGKVDALVKDPIRYKDQLRSLFNAHKRVAELERQLAEAKKDCDALTECLLEDRSAVVDLRAQLAASEKDKEKVHDIARHGMVLTFGTRQLFVDIANLTAPAATAAKEAR